MELWIVLSKRSLSYPPRVDVYNSYLEARVAQEKTIRKHNPFWTCLMRQRDRD